MRRIVRADDGTEAAYDRLLIAHRLHALHAAGAGQGPRGRDRLPRHRRHRGHDRRRDARYKHAVVIGGGLLGLEAANGLMLRGMKVTVVHVMPWLMERQLDDVAGELLRKSLVDRGLEFLIGAQTAGAGRRRSERPREGRPLQGRHARSPADLVVMAAGIRPNTALAE